MVKVNINTRAIDFIEGIAPGKIHIKKSVTIKVPVYVGMLARYLDGGALQIGDHAAYIYLSGVSARHKFPNVDERYQDDWLKLGEIIRAARDDGIDLLILAW